MINELREKRKQKAREMFDGIDDYTKDDLFEAITWAKETLRDLEGSGHHFNLSANKDGTMVCSFAKPEWAGDHSGSPMYSAGEAIVIAVCEYMSGC